MVIGSSGPPPLISCRMAEPMEVTRSETCRGAPSMVPSQEPARAFSLSKDFCASDCAVVDNDFCASDFAEADNDNASANPKVRIFLHFMVLHLPAWRSRA